MRQICVPAIEAKVPAETNMAKVVARLVCSITLLASHEIKITLVGTISQSIKVTVRYLTKEKRVRERHK
jgi:hypothetical protein